jgi:hypothetical protein
MKQRFSWMTWLVSGACALVSLACSGSEGGATGGLSSGVVSDEWRAYCVATFTETYAVQSSFDGVLFTAEVGAEYLMAHYGERSGEDAATLMYLTAEGPWDLQFTAPLGSRDFPFTSNCEFNGGTEYYAAFEDVSVYASEALDDKLCDLSGGTAMVRDLGLSTGFAASSFNFNGPATYELMLNGFSEQCGGAQRGYISVPVTTVFGSTTWLVPVQTIIGPG